MPTNALPKRLKDALKFKKYSTRQLFIALKKQEIRGAKSYSGVHSYVTGKTTPGIAFVEAAAKELGVRFAWLIAGDGEMTEEEQRTEKHRSLEEDIPELRKRCWWLGHLPISLQRRFRDLWIDYTLQMQGARLLWREDPPEWKELRFEMAEDLSGLLLFGGTMWGFRIPTESTDQELMRLVLYLERAIGALELLVQSMHQGDSLTDWPGSALPTLRGSDAAKDKKRVSALNDWMEAWERKQKHESSGRLAYNSPENRRIEGGMVKRTKRADMGKAER